MPRRPKPDRYRPSSLRQRALILLLAVVAAVAVLLALLGPRLQQLKAPRPARAEAPPCTDGRLDGCVGGKLDVLVLPAPGAAAASGATSAGG